MGSNHHIQVVSLQKCVQAVGSKIDNIVLFLRITHKVLQETVFFFVFVWVAPKKIKDFLVVIGMIVSKFDLDWSLKGVDALKILDGWTNTSMNTEDFAV